MDVLDQTDVVVEGDVYEDQEDALVKVDVLELSVSQPKRCCTMMTRCLM